MANDLTRRNNFLDNMMNMRNLMNDDFFSDFTPVEDHMKTDIEEPLLVTVTLLMTSQIRMVTFFIANGVMVK